MICPPRDASGTQRQPTRGRVRLQQHRKIEVSGATLECTLYGSGPPVVLLANAGCSSSYFDDLARALAAGGLQAIAVNMRGVGGSLGSLEDATVHDLAADVVGVLEALDCNGKMDASSVATICSASALSSRISTGRCACKYD